MNRFRLSLVFFQPPLTPLLYRVVVVVGAICAALRRPGWLLWVGAVYVGYTVFALSIFDNAPYHLRSQILPTATRADLLTGREVADIGQCCPTSFTTGNLANHLKAQAKAIGVDEVAQKYVYVTAGSCGACRFGQ